MNMVIDTNGIGTLILKEDENINTLEFEGLGEFKAGIYEVLEFVNDDVIKITLGERIGGLSADEM